MADTSTIVEISPYVYKLATWILAACAGILAMLIAQIFREWLSNRRNPKGEDFKPCPLHPLMMQDLKDIKEESKYARIRNLDKGIFEQTTTEIKGSIEKLSDAMIEEFKSLRETIGEIKVQMAEIKKNE